MPAFQWKEERSHWICVISHSHSLSLWLFISLFVPSILVCMGFPQKHNLEALRSIERPVLHNQSMQPTSPKWALWCHWCGTTGSEFTIKIPGRNVVVFTDAYLYENTAIHNHTRIWCLKHNTLMRDIRLPQSDKDPHKAMRLCSTNLCPSPDIICWLLSHLSHWF